MGLLEKLKAGKRNIKVVPFPGQDDSIGITVLTESEVQEATFATERLFKANDIAVSATTIGAYNAELNTQILFRALVNPAKQRQDGTHERMFKTADELRGLIVGQIKDRLVEEYNALEEECSPSPLKMGDDEFERLFDSLKKSPETIGNSLNLRTLRGLIIYLANRPATSQTDSGSIS